MLSAIEHGMVERIVNCRPKLAIYQALVGHIARSAGYSSWDKHGPKYIIQNGRLENNGNFDDTPAEDGHYFDTVFSYAEKKINSQLNKSYFYRKFFKDRYTITAQDIQLFLEIVDASRNKLIEKNSELEFHVILWNMDENDDTYQKIRDRLNEKSINYHLISNILPASLENMSKYQISNLEKHPNPLAHRLIAEYVMKSIIGM